MNEKLDLYDTIKAHVSQLSYGWFLCKEKEFKSMEQYDDSKETITCENFDFFIEDKWFIEVDEYGISPGDSFVQDVIIDLRKFCDCYLPLDTRTGCGKYPSNELEDELRLFNIDELSSDLLNMTEIFSKDIDNDSQLLFKYISKVLGIIKKELDSLKALYPKDIIYNGVLDDFFEKCVSKIHAKYERKLATYNLTETLPDYKASTLENPLSYFEYLVSENEIKYLIIEFQAKTEVTDNYPSVLNEKKLIITYDILNDDGEWYSHGTKFSDLFKENVRQQILITQGLIGRRIHELLTEPEVSKFLLLIGTNIKRLLEIIKTKKQSEYLKVCKQSILGLVNYINVNFNVFFSFTVKRLMKPLLKDAEKVNQNLLPLQNIRYEYAFNYIGVELETFTSLIWGYLINDYIGRDDHPNFINIFTAKVKKEDIVKIHWQKKYNQAYTNKKSLFYLFTKLMETGFIENITSKTLKEKLVLLFCNGNGTSFQGTIHSNYNDFILNHGRHDRIDQMITALLSFSGSHLQSSSPLPAQVTQTKN